MTIVCPGPVSGPEDTPRVLYGPKGLIQRIEPQDNKRLDVNIAVQLIANAMAAGVTECWLAKQPVLTLGRHRNTPESVAELCDVRMQPISGLGCSLALADWHILSVLRSHAACTG